jgi:hypothetical protein
MRNLLKRAQKYEPEFGCHALVIADELSAARGLLGIRWLDVTPNQSDAEPVA